MAGELHEQLLRYPIFNKPQHYPESMRINSYNKCYHDLIKNNLNSLIPNIDIGYRESLTEPEMIEWIRLAKEYTEKLNAEFQQACTNEAKRLRKTIEQKEKCIQLNMENVKKLPDDIIRHIYDYLLLETKLDFFLSKYSTWKETLTKKLSVKQFTSLLSILYEKYYSNIDNKRLSCISETHRILCVKKDKYNNKPQALLSIERWLTLFRNAKPNTQENNRYYQEKALSMFKLLIYLAYHYKKQPKPRTR